MGCDGIGSGEMLVIAVIVMIAVGPKRLPTLMKALGRSVREFRRATRELRAQVGLDELDGDVDVGRLVGSDSLTELRRSVLAPLSTVLADDVPLHAPPVSPISPSGDPTQPSVRLVEYPTEGVDLAEAMHRAANASGTASPGAPSATPQVEAAPVSLEVS